MIYSMKDHIRDQVTDALTIMDRSNMTESDKWKVIDLILSYAYLWCETNALFKAFDEQVTSKVDAMTYQSFYDFKAMYERMREIIVDTYPDDFERPGDYPDIPDDYPDIPDDIPNDFEMTEDDF